MRKKIYGSKQKIPKMRILRILLIFLFIPFTASAQFYVTGDDPGHLKWNYIDTESYRVIYPQGADSLAKSYARKLEKYIRTKKAAKNEEMRAKIFEDLVPVVIKQSALLAEKDVPEYEKIMDEVTHKAKIMDMRNRLKQPEIEPMQIKIEEQKTRFTTEYDDEYTEEEIEE